MCRGLVLLLSMPALGWAFVPPRASGAASGLERGALLSAQSDAFIPPPAEQYYAKVQERKAAIARGEESGGFVDDASELAKVIDLDFSSIDPSQGPGSLSPEAIAQARMLREQEHNLESPAMDAELEEALLDMFRAQGDVKEE